MALQNRVTPFGEIVADPSRGLFTGNRGIIHDPATRTLLSRRWSSKAWLICRCDFEGRRRKVMATRSWTELFFLDEATALAAGHRPCFYCRRADAEHFRTAWSVGNGEASPPARAIDAKLHQQRLDQGRKRLHALAGDPHTLPIGAMISADGAAFLVAGQKFLAWTFDGYQSVRRAPPFDGVLTPPATLAALAAGYRPVLHPSAERLLELPT